MATARRATASPTDPAILPDWLFSFERAADHWTSLVDPRDEPANFEAIRNSWVFWKANRIYREVSVAWLAEHAPDMDLFDFWNEERRRAGLPPIFGRHGRAGRPATPD